MSDVRWRDDARGPLNFGDPSIPERIWNNAIPEPNSNCWFWLGAKAGAGYGLTHTNVKPRNKRKRYVHRLILELIGIPCQAGLEVDHKCKNRLCFNPQHLEAVTHLENIRRGGNAAKTHCIRGHEFTAVNTYTGKSGKRNCITCRRTAYKYV